MTGEVLDDSVCLLASGSPFSCRSAYVFLRRLLGKGVVRSLRRQINKTIGAQSMRFMWSNATRHGDISSRKPTLVEAEFDTAVAGAAAASTPKLHSLLPVNLAAHEGNGKSLEQS